MAFSRIIDALSRARVLVVGDVMLDRYTFGTVDRVSPEAPIPVLRYERQESRLGGAANVLRNLRGLRARAYLAGVIGSDEAGRQLAALVREAGAETDGLVAEDGRETTVKERFIAGGHQLLRLDHETETVLSPSAARRLLKAVRARLPDVDLLVLSDYGKGTLTTRVTAEIVAAAREVGCPVIVDPKGRDYAKYNGAFLLTPNTKELSEGAGLPAKTDEETVRACRLLLDRYQFGGVLATRGPLGMTLVLRDEAEIHLRARATDVSDVTGAGDSVVAALAAGLATGVPPVQAAFLANIAAGIVVRKLGTAVAYPGEVAAALHESGSLAADAKIVRLDELLVTVQQCREVGRRVGFTNGCFDLLHPGHVSLLRQAKAACDFLVVGLNSDASVRRLKGPLRPVQDESARAAVLASLGMVDRIVIFDQDTPGPLIEAIRPDVLVKGSDYRLEQVVGASFVQSYGGAVILAELASGFSTSSTLRRIAEQNAAE